MRHVAGLFRRWTILQWWCVAFLILLNDAEALDLTTNKVRTERAAAVGFGWMLPAGGDSFWHNGGTRGYSSYLGVDSKQKLGVVVLVNQGLAQETTELGTALMRLVRTETFAAVTE